MPFQKGNKLGTSGRLSYANGGKGGHIQRANSLLEKALPKVVQSVIESALAGDMQACKMIFDKKLASLKSVEVSGMDASKLPTMVIQGAIIEGRADIVDAELIEDKSE